MSVIRSLFAAGLLLAAPAVASAAAFNPPATCEADLAALDPSFEETQARLSKVTKEDHVELCAAVKHHIEVMEHAAAVFVQCTPEGHDQRENLGQVLGTAADFRDISADQGCPPLPEPQRIPWPE
jgi:hypothetical protein